MKKIILILMISEVLSAGQKYQLKCNAALLAESEKVALAQVGILEKTNRNDGDKVAVYQQAAGLGTGSAYCAAGQFYCYLAACRNLGLSVDLIPFPKTGLANAIYGYAAKNGVPAEFKAERNDFLVWRKSSSVFGHIERILRTGKAGWVTTVAFNTSSGDKEGVFIKKRNIFHPLSRMTVRGLVGFLPERSRV